MASGKLELYGMTPIRALPITTHNELIALTTISSFQGQNEAAFPGLDKLAERSGLSKQAFSKAVTGLVKKNLVNRRRRYGSSNIYFVVWEFADKAQIKKENDAERRMSRAKILAKNIQLSESIRYSSGSDVDCQNDSDVSYPNGSDDILKEQYKRTELKEQPEKLTSSKFIEYKNRLRSIDEKFNLSYLESSKANQYYEQAQKKYEELNSNKSFSEFFESILTKLEKLTSQKLDRFAFKQGFTIESLVKFDLQGCAKVEAWYNDCYPQSHKTIIQQVRPEKQAPTKFSNIDLDSLKEFLA